MAEVTISRPTPPRPEDYVVVPGSQGPRRDFRFSVGLRQGWDAEGRVFEVSSVRTARAWMKRRVESDQPAALSGMFTRAEVAYAWPRDDGTVGSDREPLFTGEASTCTSVISPMRLTSGCCRQQYPSSDANFLDPPARNFCSRRSGLRAVQGGRRAPVQRHAQNRR